MGLTDPNTIRIFGRENIRQYYGGVVTGQGLTTMSGANNCKGRRDLFAIEMERGEDLSYMGRFRIILKADYKNKKAWWSAVERLLKTDGDFREKVSHSVGFALLTRGELLPAIMLHL